MKTELTTRLIASAVAFGMTTIIFSAVVSLAEQPRADGTVRLAHSAPHSPLLAGQVVLAQAETGAGE